MKLSRRLGAVRRLGFAKHVHGDSAPEDVDRPHPVDRLLHLAMAPVASLHGVGCRGQKVLVEERQGLGHRGREEFLQLSAYRFEATNTRPQPGELPEGGVRSTAAVEEPVNLVHDLAERAEGGLTSADPQKSPGFGRRAVMLDEEVTVLEEVGDFRLQPFLRPGEPGGLSGARTPARRRRDLCPDGFAYLRHRPQDSQGQVRDDVELANLVWHIAEDFKNGLRIQGGSVSRDPFEFQPTAIEGLLEVTEEPQDVLVRRVVVKDLVQKPSEPPVVHNREHTERAIVEFVGGNISGEIAKDLIQVVTLDERFAFFSPPPRPSSGLWQTGRRPDDPAKDATKRLGTPDRPRRPDARQSRLRGGCSCSPATQGPTCRR